MGNLSLRLFFRVASRNREVYLLKIITLSVAIASATVVILFSLNEFGYDRFHRDAHSVFRVLEKNVSELHVGNRTTNRIPSAIHKRLETALRDSAVLSRVLIMKGLTGIGDGEPISEIKVHSADAEISGIFSFDVRQGSLAEFGVEANTAMISASAAERFFGVNPASGQRLLIISDADTLRFTVTAVFEDFPKNAHEDFSVFISFDSASIERLGFAPEKTGVYGRSLHCEAERLAFRIASLANSGDLVYSVQPLPEIYFGPRIAGEDSSHGDSYSVFILMCITGLILFLALTNYVNLTTLTLPYRSKELAVKKLAGTGQAELFFTFSKESLLIVVISFLCGMLLLFLTAAWVDSMLSIDIISLVREGDIALFSVIAGVLAVLTLAPLFLTLRFIKASPNRLLSTEKITFPRLKRTITVLQLGTSIFLIISAVVIKRQINYSLLKEPGRNHDQVVYLDFPDDLTSEGLQRIRSAWEKYNANIVDVIATSQLPDRISSKEITSPFYSIAVDQYFPNFFNLNMVEGNWFKVNAGDSIIVLNEKGRRYLTPEDSANVIGVIDDLSSQFNVPQKPVKYKISTYFNYHYVCVRILEVDIRRTIDYLSNFFDGAKINILNARFEEWLRYQDRLNTLSDFLAVISAVLSCCAIYGLSVSLVRDKLKQIAVHKICGATGLNITMLLAREFVRSLFISLLVFAPITYIFLTELLRNFVYATRLEWFDPLFPLAYCVFTVFILCGFQALSLRRADLTSALKD
jgi:putative ABC transport system permease protein